MTFVPTLNFNGKCREAMNLYQKAFDGKVIKKNADKEIRRSCRFNSGFVFGSARHQPFKLVYGRNAPGFSL